MITKKQPNRSKMSPEETALFQARLRLSEIRSELHKRPEAAKAARELAATMVLLADRLEAMPEIDPHATTAEHNHDTPWRTFVHTAEAFELFEPDVGDQYYDCADGEYEYWLLPGEVGGQRAQVRYAFPLEILVCGRETGIWNDPQFVQYIIVEQGGAS